MKANYDGIAYPFHKLKAGVSVLEAYKDLAEIPIFHVTDGLPNGLDNEFVMRYIILMYAKGSPAIDKFPHMGRRRSWVMLELGVPMNEDKTFPKEYDVLLLNKNALILQKKCAFLSLQNPSSWQIWLNATEQLHDLLQTEVPSDPKVAGERVKLINELNSQIEYHRDRVKQHETSMAIENALQTFMAVTLQGLRPEEMVMMNIKVVPPHKVKADTIFPEVGN
jgi:hypothetical protein